MKRAWRPGNRVTLLENGEAYYPRVFECIAQARHEVIIETFILFEDKVGLALRRHLIDAAERGVKVALTIDGWGSPDLSRGFIDGLTAAGVALHVFDPAPKLYRRLSLFRRLHRKIVVIDGERAFIGGINFSADHLGDYGPEAKQDYAVELQGPIVEDIHRFALRAVRPARFFRGAWPWRATAGESDPGSAARQEAVRTAGDALPQPSGTSAPAGSAATAGRAGVSCAPGMSAPSPSAAMPAGAATAALHQAGAVGWVDRPTRAAGPPTASPAAARHWWQRRAPAAAPAAQPHAGTAQALLVTRDNRHHLNDIERQYRLAIRAARHEVIIANAYFFPGLRLLHDLRAAARRGVKVQLILQGQPDMAIVTFGARMLYPYLLEAGVTIHEYCRRPLHGKVALADDEWATVGSSNLDPLSLSLNLEANVVLRDRAFNQHLRERLQALMREHCSEIRREDVPRPSGWRLGLSLIAFHLLRHFPRWAQLLPQHRPRVKAVTPPAASTDGPASAQPVSTPGQPADDLAASRHPATSAAGALVSGPAVTAGTAMTAGVPGIAAETPSGAATAEASRAHLPPAPRPGSRNLGPHAA